MPEYLDALRALTDPPNPVRALALLSGGLDSMLAVKVLQAQGVEVEAVNFNTGFCTVEYQKRLGGVDSAGNPIKHECASAAEQLGIDVDIVDISLDYLDVIMAPKYGYGSAANPCTDCRIFMLRQARQLMERRGCHFIVTGEVLGQRPKSQKKPTMRLIERQAGLDGFLVRPLCAKNLTPTVPEEQGWIDRDRLLDFSGRTRLPQMALAEEYGLTDYPTPAGGCCMLVEQAYANRFFDYLRCKGRDAFDYTDITLLRLGRHFRINDRLKVIVGRNHAENTALTTYKGARPHLYCKDVQGPLAVVDGDPTDDEKRSLAAIVARYGDGPADELCRVAYAVRDEELEVLEVMPLAPEQLTPMQLIATPKKNPHRGARRKFDRATIPAASLAAIDFKSQLERDAHRTPERGAPRPAPAGTPTGASRGR